MSRRNLIPLAILAALVVLTGIVAVVGATTAPSAETITVQNASTRTFGTPTGSVSFRASLTLMGSGPTGQPVSQQEILSYSAPLHRIDLYVVTAPGTIRRIAEAHGAAATCALNVFSSFVGGSTAWAATGDGNYTRTESLADYTSRVPNLSSPTCATETSPIHGQVNEQALVGSDYLVKVHLTFVVPSQTFHGRPVPAGQSGQQLEMLRIGNTPIRASGP
jgi:hypothetical protein